MSVMDFLDGDDGFIKSFPSMTDWFPKFKDGRQVPPNVPTATLSTISAGSNPPSGIPFDEMGPWATSALGHGWHPTGANSFPNINSQLPSRQPSPSCSNVVMEGFTPNMGMAHPLELPFMPEVRAPAPGLSPKGASVSASTAAIPSQAGVPWPWGYHSHHTESSRSGIQVAPALLVMGTNHVTQPPSKHPQQVLLQQPQQTHWIQAQQQQTNMLCLGLTQGERFYEDYIPEEDALWAEIRAAPWPSSKMCFDAKVAAFEAAVALANSNLAPSAPLSSAASSCGLTLSQSLYVSCSSDSIGGASAPATPLLLPPPSLELCSMGKTAVPVVALELPRVLSTPNLQLPHLQSAPSPEELFAAAGFHQSALTANQGLMRFISEDMSCTASLHSAALTAAPAAALALPASSTGTDRITQHALAPNAAVAMAVEVAMSHDDPLHALSLSGQLDISDDAGSGWSGGNDGSGFVTAATTALVTNGVLLGHGSSAVVTAGGGSNGRVTLEALRSLFDLPVQDVVRALGISQTDLKRRCRALGIHRWPQRKLNSLKRLKDAVETDMALTEDQRNEMLDQVARNRVRILADPDADVEECLKPVRQQHYKKKFVNRHSAKRL